MRRQGKVNQVQIKAKTVSNFIRSRAREKFAVTPSPRSFFTFRLLTFSVLARRE